MPRATATAYMRRNGFSCAQDQSRRNDNQIKCERQTTEVVCRVTYIVYLSFDAESIADRKASSYVACL